ncbi:MAG: UvrD-helicase domain-containing protein [Leptospiraceae bacterium]|nr:UvrD-helicase domain-containing protein [Leptospiraceae bacterium]MCP5499076.1 UvrD-helicase domain-containing protein [Leptospiraceae bacterium]
MNTGLSEEQQVVVKYEGNFQQVIAGAGSGKTHTMISLLEYILQKGEEKQEEILVITFSRKAVQEITERLEKKVGKNAVNIKTFHAYCLSVLKRYHPVYKKGLSIIEESEKEELIRAFLKKERFKIGGIPYEFFLSGTSFTQTHFPDLAMQIETLYSSYKEAEKKLDFDDLIQVYLNALKENMDWALQAKKEVKRVIVDEFQDTDLVQLEWLKLLQPEKLTVVGDDWQAIYGFRGASTIPFLEFPNLFQPCEVNFLRTNYRSLPEVVKTSAIPIHKNKGNIPKEAIPKRKGKSFVYKLKLDKEDFLGLVSSLQNSKEDYKILCRSNYRIREYQKAGIAEDKLMTIHGSKGLEFTTVYLDLLSGWNLKPDCEKETLEEERRILYVGLSRAKDNLFILGNRKKDKKRIEDLFFSYFRFRVSSISKEKWEKMI